MRWFRPTPKEASAIKADAKPAKEKLVFAKAIGDGYLDSEGVWYSTLHAASSASAVRHIKSRLAYNDTNYLRMGFLGDNLYRSLDQILQEPDVIRAMAILGESQ